MQCGDHTSVQVAVSDPYQKLKLGDVLETHDETVLSGTVTYACP